MECAGMIGEAVGRTRFKSDGLAMMSTLMVRIYTNMYGKPGLVILLASNLLLRGQGAQVVKPSPRLTSTRATPS